MAKVSWIDRDIYIVKLDEEEQERLKICAGTNLAGSTVLACVIKSGLELMQRVKENTDVE